MKMEDFLKDCAREFRDRGTIHMARECETLLEQADSLDLGELFKETEEKRNSFQKFSVEYQYYWSLMTHLQDMERRFKESALLTTEY